MTINGQFYRGGQWIPGRELTKARRDPQQQIEVNRLNPPSSLRPAPASLSPEQAKQRQALRQDREESLRYAQELTERAEDLSAQGVTLYEEAMAYYDQAEKLGRSPSAEQQRGRLLDQYRRVYAQFKDLVGQAQTTAREATEWQQEAERLEHLSREAEPVSPESEPLPPKAESLYEDIVGLVAPRSGRTWGEFAQDVGELAKEATGLGKAKALEAERLKALRPLARARRRQKKLQQQLRVARESGDLERAEALERPLEIADIVLRDAWDDFRGASRQERSLRDITGPLLEAVDRALERTFPDPLSAEGLTDADDFAAAAETGFAGGEETRRQRQRENSAKRDWLAKVTRDWGPEGAKRTKARDSLAKPSRRDYNEWDEVTPLRKTKPVRDLAENFLAMIRGHQPSESERAVSGERGGAGFLRKVGRGLVEARDKMARGLAEMLLDLPVEESEASGQDGRQLSLTDRLLREQIFAPWQLSGQWQFVRVGPRGGKIWRHAETGQEDYFSGDPNRAAVEPQKTLDDGDRWKTRFEVAGLAYDFAMEKTGEGSWSFEFRSFDPEQRDHSTTTLPREQRDRNALGVLAQVGKSLLQFMREKKPKRVSFSASQHEPSRVRLYNALAPRLAAVTGYKLTSRKRHDLQEYFLTRQGQAVPEAVSWRGHTLSRAGRKR